MGKKFVNTGPLAGQVGLPEGKHWRCPACTLLCRFAKDQCPRCTETVSPEEKIKYEVKHSDVKRKHIPLHLAKPNQQKRRPAPVKKKTSGIRDRLERRAAVAGEKKKKNERSKRTPSTSSSTSSKKTKSVRGFNSKGKTTKVSMTKKTTKKMGKPIHKQDPKKLGYEPSRKGNVSSYTRSKLNDDTASYRGKFQHTAKPLGGRKMNIATIGHLVSKNGFNTTIKKMKTGWDKHGDRPVTPPPSKKGKKDKPSSWISALQQAASTGAVASLKHRGVHHHASHLDIDGKKSKYAL